MRLSLALVALLLTAGLAGCIGDDEAAPGSTQPAAANTNASLTLGEPVSPISECTINCKEPTVAVDPEGRIFVAEHLAHNDTGQPDPQQAPERSTGLARSTDGGDTWERLGTPAEPATSPPGTCQGDSLVQIGPEGSLYFTALLFQCVAGAGNAQAIHGVQVARSDDGGETWALNTVVSVANDARHGTIQPDRQWLGFGEDGTVYLTYATHSFPLGIGVFIHRSDDRGETWSQPSLVASSVERGAYRSVWPGQAGPPVVDSQGTIYLPMSWVTEGLQEPLAVRVAVSTDQGDSWKHHEAFRAPRAGNGYPMLTVDQQDRLHLAALSGEGLTLTTSTDGAETWSDPVAWTESDPPNGTAPWIAAVDVNLTVAYYQDSGNGSVSLELAQRPLAAEPGSGPTQRVTVAEGLPSAHTDFAHFAEGPVGPWVTWGDADAEEVRLVGPEEGSP